MVLSNLTTNTVIYQSSKRSPFKNFLSRPERHPLMSDETPCHQEDSSFHSATSEYRVESVDPCRRRFMDDFLLVLVTSLKKRNNSMEITL